MLWILKIPESVTFISNMIFHSCNGFYGSLVIGRGHTVIDSNSTNKINNDTFNGCSGFSGTQFNWGFLIQLF